MWLTCHEERGTAEAIIELKMCAAKIARQTPLDSDSWDDPEDWQIDAVELAHGFLELLNHLEFKEATIV